MTLDEAISALTALLRDTIVEYDPYYINGIKLGIEALKRLKKLRDNYSPYSIAPLPGETEK